jgi:hypothetical protein
LNPLWEVILIWTRMASAISVRWLDRLSLAWRQPPQNWDASNAATAITCTASMCFIIITSTGTSLTLS